METRQIIGSHFLRARKEKGITTYMVAEASEITPKRYEKIENGQVDGSFEEIASITKALNLDINSIASREAVTDDCISIHIPDDLTTLGSPFIVNDEYNLWLINEQRANREFTQGIAEFNLTDDVPPKTSQFYCLRNYSAEVALNIIESDGSSLAIYFDDGVSGNHQVRKVEIGQYGTVHFNLYCPHAFRLIPTTKNQTPKLKALVTGWPNIFRSGI